MQACGGTKDLRHEVSVGEYQGFQLRAAYNLFANQYELCIRGQGSYTVEVGRDPIGNITRISNALEALPKRLDETRQKLELLTQQLETAKEEAQRPFPQEQELAEKQARLSALNSLLNMDERRSEAATLDDDAGRVNLDREQVLAQDEKDDRKCRNGFDAER